MTKPTMRLSKVFQISLSILGEAHADKHAVLPDRLNYGRHSLDRWGGTASSIDQADQRQQPGSAVNGSMLHRECADQQKRQCLN